jgi:hypothetical protein
MSEEIESSLRETPSVRSTPRLRKKGKTKQITKNHSGLSLIPNKCSLSYKGKEVVGSSTPIGISAIKHVPDYAPSIRGNKEVTVSNEDIMKALSQFSQNLGMLYSAVRTTDEKVEALAKKISDLNDSLHKPARPPSKD